MKRHMIFKGFKFGLLLQLAVGPICLYIFNTAIVSGFINAIAGVIGVVIIDGIFIALSIIGITSLVKNNEQILKIFGTLILVLFGINTIYNAIFINKDVRNVIVSKTYLDIFIKAIILTGANPLTIVFWSGVFSSKIIEENFSRTDEILFGIGAVLSTFICLTVVSIMGQFTSQFINENIIRILNIMVGMMLIYFGFRLLLNKNSKT